MSNSDGLTKETTLSISYELLCLLRWLSQYNTDELKTIIESAIRSGLDEDLEKKETNLAQSDIHHSIIDFLEILEVLLLQVVTEQVALRAKEQKLMPSIDKIDTSICDDSTLRSSLEKATSKMVSHPQENPTEVLFKELLRRWKPHDKNIKN